MIKKLISLSNLTLLVALALSSVAAYYSIIGLTAIFAGAVIPIVVMGSILEVGKITTTVWLRKYWHRAGWVIKIYLVPAVVLLALLTSMGIFGFLSKAHMDQGITSGDVTSKIAIYDEKIKTAKENIEANRKQLKQMDEAVDQIMGRSTDEKGADKANAVRKSQQRDRTALAKDIEANQRLIASLNDEAAPIRAEVRKVEAEVGPIKYIAALIYGDNPDANTLEAAVRWVIILLVIVFDPLAIALVLAANQSKGWDEEEPEEEPEEEHKPDAWVADVGEKPTEEEKSPLPDYEPDDGPINQEVLEQLRDRAQEELSTGELVTKSTLLPLEVTPEEEEAFIALSPKIIEVEPIPQPVNPGIVSGEGVIDVNLKSIDVVINEEDFTELANPIGTVGSIPKVSDAPVAVPVIDTITDIEMANTTVEPFKVDGNYVAYDGGLMHKDAFQSLRPELFKLRPDEEAPARTDFGTKFPEIAFSGDIFVRVDTLPNRIFKFNGKQWLELNREKTESYLFNQKYIQHLVEKLGTGEYDPELLTDAEKESIEEFLKGQTK